MEEKEMVACTQSEREKKSQGKKNLVGTGFFLVFPLKLHSILRGLHKVLCIVSNV
jgi:hypothetical protein